ncbi:HAMP domain-containing sensor histidine kinase [Sinomonas notoginsengisoli]|uniref:sensor histidine kinase n=1 Tax=Sinomonas notoginsengisoli TaxID=1457311 RepID=UPI001F25B299|nr:HAMP domain-containing sensor histidine kinase [Sinomonas notoginsengisoli]
MRLRVLGILSLFAIIVVVAVSAAILASVGRELTQELQISRVAALNRFAQVADDAASSGDTVPLQREMDRYSELYGEGVVVRTPQATLTSAGLSADRPDVRDALARARLNLNDTTLASVQPLGPGSEVVARSFGTASQVLGEAALEVDLRTAQQTLRERWLLVVLGAIAVAALLVAGAERVTVWVLRPVHRLTAAVADFEETGRPMRLREEGPPELQQLSRAFSAMAEHVGASMEAQRQLIADASHQLRNPIGALRLRTDLLGLALETPAQKAAAAGMTRELEHVEEILDGLLRLASAEHRAREGAIPGGGTLGERAGVLDVWAVLAEAVEHTMPAAELAGARLELADAPAQPVRVLANRSDLADLIGELLENAVKYGTMGGGSPAHVRAAASLHGTSAVIEIADRGPGLTPEERSASTTRFWRSPRHLGTRGTGLGLSIVDQLATANGGRLVLADAEPHGLVARVEFPVLRRDAAPHDAGPSGGADLTGVQGEGTDA